MTFEKSLRLTVTYFDAFSFPLTDVELWENCFAYSGSARTYADFLRVLDGMIGRRELARTRGMIHLLERGEIVWTRHDRTVISERKYRHALRVARMFAHVPFVRMVAVCNSLAFSHASDESDIDYLIIARSGWIWCSRFFTAGLAALLRLRPGERNDMRDTICLSFFVTDTTLSLELVALPDECGFGDVHLCSLVRHIVPLYDDSGALFDAFVAANAWADRQFANPATKRIHWRRTVSLSVGGRMLKRIIQLALRPFRRVLEAGARRLQLSILPANLREKMNRGTAVVMNDAMLKFHPNDRREESRKKFQERIRSEEL